MPVYAVRKGRVPGVYATWGDCQEQIVKFSGASYKKFATEDLALAFVNGCNNPAEAAMSSGDWAASCKQALMEFTNTLTQSVSQLNKYSSTLPDNLKKNDAITAGFKESKADVIMCKDTVGNLLKLISDGDADSTSLKRSHDDSDAEKVEKVKKVKKSPSSDGEVPVVYTDGACINNGQANSRAGIGVWWGVDDERNISRSLAGRQTNNRAEIQAACEAVQQAKDLGYSKLEIRTDSQFMISSITEWVSGWKQKNWKLANGDPVKNKEDFKRLDSLCRDIEIVWTHVRGHSGIEGNEQADRLANAGAQQR